MTERGDLSEREQGWMEIFHSKPSMQRCHFIERHSNGEWSTPSIDNQLQDAGHIRSGFRVIRRRATPVEFALTDGTDRNWDDNDGKYYKLDAMPGRYVVEHGIRRVGEPNVDECRQAVLRRDDKYIHICFRADLWERCFANFQADANEWTEAPGEEMTLVPNDELNGQNGRRFELIIKAKRLVVAFNNGNGVWDANHGDNYRIGLPGKYVFQDGCASYVGPSDLDVELDGINSSSSSELRDPNGFSAQATSSLKLASPSC